MHNRLIYKFLNKEYLNKIHPKLFNFYISYSSPFLSFLLSNNTSNFLP